jgi:methionyl aminopeptidase
MSNIPLKSKKEIEIMRENGRILVRIMKELEKEVKPGIRTIDLDKCAEELVSKFKGIASFKGYKGFPKALCVSINEELVHGMPSKRKLKKGDIVSLDLGFLKNGFHADMALTLGLGKISKKVQKLINVTKEALDIGVRYAVPGNTFKDLGGAIQKYVEKKGYGVVRGLCGHGIGKELHEKPQVLNYKDKRVQDVIKEGMVFCIEPMVTIGDWHVIKKEDGFTFATKDGSLCAHFEHMVAVTGHGPRVLTKL